MKKRVIDIVFTVVFFIIGLIFLASSANDVTGAVVGVSSLVSSLLQLSLAGIFLALSMVSAAKSGPEEGESLDEYLEKLTEMARRGKVLDNFEYYTNHKGEKGENMNKTYRKLGKFATGDTRAFGVKGGSSDAGITHDTYSFLNDKDRSKIIKEGIEESGEKIIKDYDEILSKTFEESWKKEVEKYKKDGMKDEDIKKLDKRAIIVDFYKNFLADILVKYGHSKDYKEEGVLNQVEKINDITKMIKDDNKSKLKKFVAQKRAGVKELAYSNIADIWIDEGAQYEEKANEEGLLVNHFIDDKGHLKVDELKKYLKGNNNAYSKIAEIVAKAKYGVDLDKKEVWDGVVKAEKLRRAA